MTKSILALFILIHVSIRAQVNLLANSGFELNETCPDYPGQINYATGWSNVNLIYNNPLVGTPDYFHKCGNSNRGYNTVPPNIFDGYCYPHLGNAMAGTILYNIPYPDYREYMSIKFSQAMLPGFTYTVSFWITSGNPPMSPFVIKNIGLHLSENPLSQTSWNLINLNPTFEIPNYAGSSSWVNYSFTINPSAGYNYLTVGSFRNDASNAPMAAFTGTTGPLSSYASYYWDDIEVWAPKGAVLNLTTIPVNDQLTISPNPISGNVLTINSTDELDEIVFMNCTGAICKQVLIKESAKPYLLNLEDLSSGIYLMAAIRNNNICYIKKIIKE